jgi:hypothetical protein
MGSGLLDYRRNVGNSVSCAMRRAGKGARRLRITKQGIVIVEDEDPIEAETYQEAVGVALHQIRHNINRIAEVLEKMQDQIDEMKGGGGNVAN